MLDILFFSCYPFYMKLFHWRMRQLWQEERKNMTYEEELTYLDSEISKTEETLKALKTRKKELAKVKEQADLQTLYAAIKESGKSVADVISSLK